MHAEPQHQVYRVSSLYEIENERRRNGRYETAGKFLPANRRVGYGGPVAITPLALDSEPN